MLINSREPTICINNNSPCFDEGKGLSSIISVDEIGRADGRIGRDEGILNLSKIEPICPDWEM